MIFDPNKLNQELEPRTGEVVCNELRTLYEGSELRVSSSGAENPRPETRDPEPIIFKVRGLTGNEFVKVAGARDSARFAEMLTDALGTGNGKDGARAIRGLLGLFDDELHPQLKYRVELVVYGSVEPRIDHALAAKLAKDFCVVLHRISDKVLELTGLGAQLKKNSASGSLATSPS
jgi:hypothetical protein